MPDAPAFDSGTGPEGVESLRLAPVSALGTPAAGRAAVIVGQDELSVVEEPFLYALTFRSSSKAGDAWLGETLAAHGLARPDRVGGMAGEPDLACGRIEPRAWIVTSAVRIECDRPAPRGWLVTDSSDSFAAFRLRGDRARELLAAGCNIAVCADQACIRTVFAETVAVLIQQWRRTDYRLLVDTSLARFVAEWVRDAAMYLSPPSTCR